MERLTKHTPVEFGYAEYVWNGNVDEQDAIDRLAAYEDTGLTPEQCAEYAEAEREGRLVVLDRKPLPLVSKPDRTDAYCPYCDEDVSGLWGVADYVPDICQCPECGEFVDVYASTITREEAEAALAEKGAEK